MDYCHNGGGVDTWRTLLAHGGRGAHQGRARGFSPLPRYPNGFVRPRESGFGWAVLNSIATFPDERRPPCSIQKCLRNSAPAWAVSSPPVRWPTSRKTL